MFDADAYAYCYSVFMSPIRWNDYNVDHIESAHVNILSQCNSECSVNLSVLGFLSTVRKKCPHRVRHSMHTIFNAKKKQIWMKAKSKVQNTLCLSVHMCIHLKSMRILLVDDDDVGASANLRLLLFTAFPFFYIQMCFTKWDQNKRWKWNNQKSAKNLNTDKQRQRRNSNGRSIEPHCLTTVFSLSFYIIVQ